VSIRFHSTLVVQIKFSSKVE